MVIRLPESVFHNSDYPSRNKDILKRHCAPPFGCQTIRTVDCKNLELSQTWHTEKEKAKAWIQPKVEHVCRRGFITVQVTLQEGLAARSWWPGPHLDQELLVYLLPSN